MAHPLEADFREWSKPPTATEQGCGERLTAPCFLGEETVRPWPGGWARSS